MPGLHRLSVPNTSHGGYLVNADISSRKPIHEAENFSGATRIMLSVVDVVSDVAGELSDKAVRDID